MLLSWCLATAHFERNDCEARTVTAHSRGERTDSPGRLSGGATDKPPDGVPDDRLLRPSHPRPKPGPASASVHLITAGQPDHPGPAQAETPLGPGLENLRRRTPAPS